MSSLSAPTGSVAATFLAPALELLADCVHARACPAFPDEAWIHLGLQRVLHELPSGRAFLQQHAFNLPSCPARANYFESIKSPRRLRLAEELNQRLCQRLVATLPDDLSAYPDLADFDLYAGDGHWHGAAAHDLPLQGTKYPVGHFYALDLRHHTLRHLAVGEGKKEHDMHVLKRLGGKALRQGAPKARKVLYVWDKAGIDFHAWHRWKQGHGVYFVSLEKENMKLEAGGLPEWDRSDPVNAGVQKVELVSGAAGVLVRRIRYREPVSGVEYVFLTNEWSLRPGLVAFLYKRRWEVEKLFDELKNKLGEQRAWASSPIAKAAQAQLICLLHNLLALVDARLKAEGIENQAEMRRRQETLAKAQKLAAAAGRIIPSPVVALQRLTQHSVKLLRWLRASFASRLAWDTATPRLRALYAAL